MTFIENASKWYRMWSIQLSMVGAMIVAVSKYLPPSYTVLPPEIQAVIPPHYAHGIGLGLIALSWIARVIPQNNVRAGNVNK